MVAAQTAPHPTVASSQDRETNRVAAVEREEAARVALERGNHQAVLTRLMTAYGDELFRYCLHMVGDEQLAEDVRQITFVQAYEGLRRFDGRSTFRTWLYSIARHRCLDTLERRRRFRKRFTVASAPPELPWQPEPGSDAPDPELVQAVRECLAKLPARVRMSVLLRYVEDKSYPDIARITGEKPATLQDRVARCLPRLLRCVRARAVTP